jgi:hypothetical protein
MSSITEAPNIGLQRFNNLQDRDRILGTSGMGNVPEEMDSSAIPNCEGKRPVFNEIDEYESNPVVQKTRTILRGLENGLLS